MSNNQPFTDEPLTFKDAGDVMAATAEKNKTLMTEIGQVSERLKADPDNFGLKQRLDNLTTAATKNMRRHEAAAQFWGEHMNDMAAKGLLGVEGEDGMRMSNAGDVIGEVRTEFGTVKMSNYGYMPTGPQSGMAEALKSARFNPQTNPSVTTSGYTVLKASTFAGPAAYGMQTGNITPMGYDTRWLFPFLPATNARNALSVDDFTQTVRTVNNTVQRAVDASTDKADLEVTVTAANEALVQFAITIDDIPNAILESDAHIAAFLANEGEFQVRKALDAHVMSQIVAATPPFGNTGTGLIAQIRNGIATMRGTGANPSLLVLNPTDAATLDLSADAGGLVFPVGVAGSSSPVWSLRVIERAGAGNEPPYLIDPNMLGMLYIGQMKFDADPYTGFKKNLTTLRVEVNALYHVRNANGARRIAAA